MHTQARLERSSESQPRCVEKDVPVWKQTTKSRVVADSSDTEIQTIKNTKHKETANYDTFTGDDLISRNQTYKKETYE